MNREREEYEVILVDDGSQQKVEVAYLKNPNTHLYIHRKRMGKGEALRTGITHARGEAFLFMDGDLQDDPQDISKFLKEMKSGADFINGIRERRKDTLLIKMYSFFANIDHPTSPPSD